MKLFFLSLILSINLFSQEALQEAALLFMKAQVDQLERINDEIVISDKRLDNELIIKVLEKNSLIDDVSQELMDHFFVTITKDDSYFSERLEKVQSLMFLLSKSKSSFDSRWIKKLQKELESFSLLIFSSKTNYRKSQDRTKRSKDRCFQGEPAPYTCPKK